MCYVSMYATNCIDNIRPKAKHTVSKLTLNLLVI